MAILLIHRGSHWMNRLSVDDVTARIEQNPKFLRRYDARYRLGDIVEIRKDGAVITNNERIKFTIIIVSEKSKNELAYLQSPEMEIVDEQDVQKKVRRYKLDKTLLSVSKQTDFNKGKVELNADEFAAALVNKKNG